MMRLTAIFVTQETTARISTMEAVLLECLGKESRRLPLGEDQNVPVGPGVFRIIAEQDVRVSDNPNLKVIKMDKPGGPIELVSLIPPDFVTDDVKAFLEPALKSGGFS